ncbi:MAG: peptidoglycan-binding protein, partial [Methyloligellaceae bacterium]
MNNIICKSSFTYGVPLTAMAVSVMLLMGSTTSANAWHYGRAHGPGVVGGAIIGGAIGYGVGKKKGVIPGAIGGAIVGGALSSRPARPAPPPPAPLPPPGPVYNNGLVYNIQLSLTKLGYSPGPVDGVYGPNTADAISAFQYN